MYRAVNISEGQWNINNHKATYEFSVISRAIHANGTVFALARRAISIDLAVILSYK